MASATDLLLGKNDDRAVALAAELVRLVGPTKAQELVLRHQPKQKGGRPKRSYSNPALQRLARSALENAQEQEWWTSDYAAACMLAEHYWPGPFRPGISKETHIKAAQRYIARQRADAREVVDDCRAVLMELDIELRAPKTAAFLRKIIERLTPVGWGPK